MNELEKEINLKYKPLHKALEDEFFTIVDEGKRTQHRELREGKAKAGFDVKHSELWQQCNAELAKLPPPRDLMAEIDALQAEINKLKLKVA